MLRVHLFHTCHPEISVAAISSDAVENDTIESIVLKNRYIVPEIVSLAPLEVI